MLSHPANLYLGPGPSLTANFFEPVLTPLGQAGFNAENVPEGSEVLWYLTGNLKAWLELYH